MAEISVTGSHAGHLPEVFVTGSHDGHLAGILRQRLAWTVTENVRRAIPPARCRLVCIKRVGEATPERRPLVVGRPDEPMTITWRRLAT